MNHPKVSILCNTHNHEAYIAQAIEGFLMQKTDFPFEICIHDDASTDKTPQILKQYEIRYPDLIKVIYQAENQFTQGKVIMDLNAQRAQGEYLAVCDGDDYWIDPDKLQKQAEILDNQPEVSLVIHAFYQTSVASLRPKTLIRYFPIDRILTIEDLLAGYGRGYGYHTYMFRRKDYLMPEVLRILRFTDLPRLLYSATVGQVAYLSAPMAVYRKGVASSWSTAQYKSPEIHAKNHQKLKQFYQNLDDHTKQRYHSLIEKRIAYSELIIAIKTQDQQAFESLINTPPLDDLSKKQKERYAFELKHLRLSAFLRSLKLKIWN